MTASIRLPWIELTLLFLYNLLLIFYTENSSEYVAKFPLTDHLASE